MSLHETLESTGRLTLRLHAPDGRVVDERVAHDDITLRGRGLVAQLMEAEVPRVSRIRVGSGDRACRPAGLRPGRVRGVHPHHQRGGVHRGRRRGQAPPPAAHYRRAGEKDRNAELCEAGLFTARDEVMYNRVTFKPINKSPQFQLTLVWDIIF